MPHCTFCNKCCHVYSNYMQNSSLILFGDTSSEIRVGIYKFGDTRSSEIRVVRRYEYFGDTRSMEFGDTSFGDTSSEIQVQRYEFRDTNSEIQVWSYEFGDTSSEIRVWRIQVRRMRHVSHKCDNGNIYYQTCSVV